MATGIANGAPAAETVVAAATTIVTETPTQESEAPAANVNGNGNDEDPAERLENKSAGDKRDIEEAKVEDEKLETEQTDGDKPASPTEPVEEPPEKKRKTEDGEEPVRSEEAEANGNGTVEKKRGPGRPKKGDVKKQSKVQAPRSTEGIGSRTRSRTQA